MHLVLSQVTWSTGFKEYKVYNIIKVEVTSIVMIILEKSWGEDIVMKILAN